MKSLKIEINKTIKRLKAAAVRIGAAAILAANGAQKLFGWVGGYGMEGSAEWMTSTGLGPNMQMASLAGSFSADRALRAKLTN